MNAAWDYADVYDGPWYVFREPRDEHRLAIKSGHFTILTASDYFDGGGPLEERLEFVCDAVNARIERLQPGQAPMSAECKKLRGPNDTGPDCGCRGDACTLERSAATREESCA